MAVLRAFNEATRWSEPFASYLAQLRSHAPLGQRVAFFDLDRTLINGYSLTALAFQQIANGDISLRRLCSLALMFAKYGLQRIDYQQMLQATVDDIKGMPEEALRDLVQQAYDNRIADSIYQEGRALIAAHRQLGHDVVMVTSATQFQAEPVAKELGFESVRCTELDVEHGVITGRVSSCYGEGKLRAAKQYIRSHALHLEDAYFYTDSDEDLPLLERVGYPIVVNAKPELAKLARRRQWQQLDFQDVGEDRLPHAA